MPADRFFVPHPLTTPLTLDGEEFSHLSRVMRKKKGDQIELVNGRGALALGTIQSCDKKTATISIDSVEHIPSALPPFILVQALPTQSHLKLILQKGTELGAAEFWLFPGDLSEKKEISTHQHRRCEQILISALKQCGRLDLPKIEFKPSLHDLSLKKENTFFGDTRRDSPRFTAIKGEPIYFVIGPEKGFSDREIAYLESHAIGVKLHPYTLRAETAAIAAMTAITLLASKSST